jgi:hypothetical protein
VLSIVCDLTKSYNYISVVRIPFFYNSFHKPRSALCERLRRPQGEAARCTPLRPQVDGGVIVSSSSCVYRHKLAVMREDFGFGASTALVERSPTEAVVAGVSLAVEQSAALIEKKSTHSVSSCKRCESCRGPIKTEADDVKMYECYLFAFCMLLLFLPVLVFH